MWLWLVVSIIILAACIIFALRIFATSYTFVSPKQEKEQPGQSVKVAFSLFRQESAVNELKSKIKTIEENYLAQFNKLQQRIDFMDHEKKKEVSTWKEEEDDGGWEDLYYKTLKDKETAEEALDAAEDKEKQLIARLQEYENQAGKEDAGKYKKRIELLERDAEAAREMEKMLESEITALKKVKRDHELLQHLYSHLLTEADELKLRIHEITNRDIALSKKVERLNELESSFEISANEKTTLRKNVEEIILENEALSTKLQELQDKLASEKYA